MAENKRHKMLRHLIVTFSRGTQAEPGTISDAAEEGVQYHQP